MRHFVLGVEEQRLAERSRSSVQIALIHQPFPEIEVGQFVFWIEAERFSKLGDRRIPVSLVGYRDSERETGVGILRVDLQRFFKLLPGLFKAVLAGQSQ